MQANETLTTAGDTDSIWLALFGLAIVGVLALYLSSEKVRILAHQYEKMQDTQEEIARQQTMILRVIGERLESSTHGIRRHREVFEEQTQGSIDQDVLQNEMIRFRRDEHLLIDALGDLNDFAQIRSGQLTLQQKTFDVNELLRNLGRQVEPHYFLRRNELVYRFDPVRFGTAVGDAERIEQILRTFLIELGQVAYESTVILGMQSDARREKVVFDLLVPESDGDTQLLDDVFSDVQLDGETHHSSRKLKSYLARELIRLMDGQLHAVKDPAFGLHYRIEVPLAVMTPSEAVRRELGGSTLIVSHNDAVALSVADMLSDGVVSGVEMVVGEGLPPSDLSIYATVIITYTALTEVWSTRLVQAQQERPVQVIILKSGFQRTLPLPESLKDVSILRLPVVYADLAAVMTDEGSHRSDRDRAAS